MTQSTEYTEISPKMNGFSIDKIKFNPDISEESDSSNLENNLNSEKKSFFDLLEKTLSIDSVYKSDIEDSSVPIIKIQDFSKSHSFNVLKSDSNLLEVPRKEITSLSGYFEIPSSSFNSNQSLMRKNNYFQHQNENQLKLCQKNLFEKSPSPDGEDIFNSSKIISISHRNNTDGFQSTSENKIIVELPEISKNDDAKKTSETLIEILEPTFEIGANLSEIKKKEFLDNLKYSSTKLTTFCKWLIQIIIFWAKKGYSNAKKLLLFVTSTRKSKLSDNEINQILTMIKQENDLALENLSLDIKRSLTQELAQNFISNNILFSTLTNEMRQLQSANTELVVINNELKGLNEKMNNELEQLNEKISKMKTDISLIEQKTTALIPLKNISSSAVVCVPPPPPPPPPPLLPLLFQSTKDSESKINIPTLKEGGNKSSFKESSRSLDSRPVITVEDIVNVSLRPVSQSRSNEYKRAKSLPTPKGPAISLEMLRSVKLKSSKKRSLDFHKSPRSTSRVMKNRSQTNLSLSPLIKGAENSLSRLLKPCDGRRVRKKSGSSSVSNSETEFSLNSNASR